MIERYAPQIVEYIIRSKVKVHATRWMRVFMGEDQDYTPLSFSKGRCIYMYTHPCIQTSPLPSSLVTKTHSNSIALVQQEVGVQERGHVIQALRGR